jgi:hypothetical protein
MKSRDTFSGLSRRTILSTCATLPIFSLLLPDPARAQPERENGPALPAGQPLASDLLQSWNDTPAKKAIFDFVERVTKQDSPDYVPPAERIATFDNDGTLWAEQPMYTQFLFALDRVKVLAPQHPDWKAKEPFASMLKGDVANILAAGEPAIIEMVVATHS